VKLCHNNRSGPVFLRHSVVFLSKCTHAATQSVPKPSQYTNSMYAHTNQRVCLWLWLCLR